MARKVRTFSRSGRASSGMRAWAIAGLVAFLAADVLLVGWALAASRGTGGTEAAPAPAPTHTVQETATPRHTPSSSPKPTASKEKLPALKAPTRVLAALDDQTAWRAQTGACPGTPASLEVTHDGGQTWAPSDASAATGAASIQRILVQSDQVVTAVALDGQTCEPEFIRTYVGGDNWEVYTGDVSDVWYVRPSDRSTVRTPGGDVASPCQAAVDVAGSDATHALLLCSDRSLYRTSDGGASWAKAPAVHGAMAVAAGGDGGTMVAAGGQDSCKGVAVASLGRDGAPTSTGCRGAAAPAADSVVLASGGDALWLWSGDDVALSEDGGASWR